MGIRRTWSDVEVFLQGQVRQFRNDGESLLNLWERTRRMAVQDKERKFGVHTSIIFCKDAERAIQTGMAVSRVCVSAELHLFTRPPTSEQLKRTYESPKIEEPMLCLLDCVLKFDEGGKLVPDEETRSPRKCRFYQFFDFRLLGDSETELDKKQAADTIHGFSGSTWHGNAGAHTAELAGLTLAFAGNEVGRFSILPDRGDSGKTTHDLSLCYLLGSSESSGRGSLGGTLRCD